MSEGAAPSADELAICIDSEGNYRILVPTAWKDLEVAPRFAYLAVAAILRLTRRSEINFIKEMDAWADDDRRKTGEMQFPGSRPSTH